MSTYYDFMVEAKYKDKWYNIDLHTKDFDGKLRHQYLATFSRSFVGQLESLIDGAWRIGFDDLAESTQNLLLRKAAGLTVHDLQMVFGFNSPQAIYKWQNGAALPTVDNLIVLAALLHVRIDDILVTDNAVA